MKLTLDKKIREIANDLDKPLYVVGGYVRNFLIDKSLSSDIDLCAPIRVEELLPKLKEFGFIIQCEYKRTGTVVFSDGCNRYEFTSFRRESYNDGGEHTPTKTDFTDDIFLDATRRDFKCNAIYYDIAKDEVVDVLGGVEDVGKKVLTTVKSAEEVFKHDGLRLLRLARFCGELDFTIDNETLSGAKKYAENIKDISPERIFDELKKILVCDTKYPFSNKLGHYNALKVLDDCGVLDYIIPELTKGRNMKQRSDFHNYDVLEHSLRCAMYADKSIRLSALLHDVGKPYCMINFSKYHDHAKYGKDIAREVLLRLKADKKTIEEVCFLTENHMLEVKKELEDGEIAFFIAKNNKWIKKLLFIMQADFSACKDDLEKASTVEKWCKIMEKMKKNNIPFSPKELDIKGEDLLKIGVKRENISKVLEFLLKEVCFMNVENDKEKLIKKANTINF